MQKIYNISLLANFFNNRIFYKPVNFHKENQPAVRRLYHLKAVGKIGGEGAQSSPRSRFSA